MSSFCAFISAPFLSNKLTTSRCPLYKQKIKIFFSHISLMIKLFQQKKLFKLFNIKLHWAFILQIFSEESSKKSFICSFFSLKWQKNKIIKSRSFLLLGYWYIRSKVIFLNPNLTLKANILSKNNWKKLFYNIFLNLFDVNCVENHFWDMTYKSQA